MKQGFKAHKKLFINNFGAKSQELKFQLQLLQ